jgi:hypothetical protein
VKDAQGNDTSETTYFAGCNRGKKSVTVDITRGEGQELVRKLAETCDPLVELTVTSTPDFEVTGGRGSASNGRDNDRGDNNNGYRNVNRPDGRMSYSGPIMNRNSAKALDVTEQGTQDGANIQQWGYAGQPNQTWDVIDLGNNQVAIINRHSGRALTVQGGRDDNGAGIIQRAWNDNPQQRWRLEQTGGDYYRIVSVDNGKCLDVNDQSKANGANIQLWDYANQANQQWRFKR